MVPCGTVVIACPLLFLDLLCAPPGVRISHVRWRFDRRHELKCHVADSDEADDRPSNDTEGVVFKDEASDEDVD